MKHVGLQRNRMRTCHACTACLEQAFRVDVRYRHRCVLNVSWCVCTVMGDFSLDKCLRANGLSEVLLCGSYILYFGCCMSFSQMRELQCRGG